MIASICAIDVGIQIKLLGHWRRLPERLCAQMGAKWLQLSHSLDTEPGFRVTVRLAWGAQGRVLRVRVSAAQAASLSVPEWVVREAFRVVATRM